MNKIAGMSLRLPKGLLDQVQAKRNGVTYTNKKTPSLSRVMRGLLWLMVTNEIPMSKILKAAHMCDDVKEVK